MSKLFRIEEDDFAELERILPAWAERLACAEARHRQNQSAPSNDNALSVQIRRIQSIITNVRWEYQPHTNIGVIDAG